MSVYAELFHEDDEVITLHDFYTVQTREISAEESQKIEAQKLEILQQQAVLGQMLWYEICATHPKGISIHTLFREPSDPILDWENLDSLTIDVISGAEIELHLFKDESAQRRIEELKFYESLFGETGTVAIGPAVPLDMLPPAISSPIDTLVVKWTKI